VGSLDNDIKTGVWTRYREDGTLMDETIFINGKKGKVKSINLTKNNESLTRILIYEHTGTNQDILTANLAILRMLNSGHLPY
jgi:antitoxin component YwqK of YwqJK toxin-antitoxin module